MNVEETFTKRSVDKILLGKVEQWKSNMLYVCGECDGDSAAQKALMQLNCNKGPYSIPVVKEHCVNHVAKRLGTRQRKLKSEYVEVKKTKTGTTRRMSRLGEKNKPTDSVIDYLVKHYGNSIRRNKGKTVDSLRKDILATIFHCTSTNDKPQHHLYCPQGKKSW